MRIPFIFFSHDCKLPLRGKQEKGGGGGEAGGAGGESVRRARIGKAASEKRKHSSTSATHSLGNCAAGGRGGELGGERSSYNNHLLLPSSPPLPLRLRPSGKSPVNIYYWTVWPAGTSALSIQGGDHSKLMNRVRRRHLHLLLWPLSFSPCSSRLAR